MVRTRDCMKKEEGQKQYVEKDCFNGCSVVLLVYFVSFKYFKV